MFFDRVYTSCIMDKNKQKFHFYMKKKTLWYVYNHRIKNKRGGKKLRPKPHTLPPPSINKTFYLEPATALINWLIKKHEQGSVLCSACKGAFILAAAGLLDNKEVTTHWKLAGAFKELYPNVRLNADKIMVNDNDIITAGEVMSRVDPGLKLIVQFTTPSIMRRLGNQLVVDMGQREQRYYKCFSPDFNHGDKEIFSIQKKLEKEYNSSIKISGLADSCGLTARTFLRRFVKATGLKPNNYKLRIQKACDLLEKTKDPFEAIAYQVGYENPGACRRVFLRIMGLPPGEFRKHFNPS